MAIKNFIKKDTYSEITGLICSKDYVQIRLTVYEDFSKNRTISELQYTCMKGEPIEEFDSYITDLVDFKKEEGEVLLISKDASVKQGIHTFTTKYVTGEKNIQNSVREHSHKKAPKYVFIKKENKTYQYDLDKNQYIEKKDSKGTEKYFSDMFPMTDKNIYELAYNYLMTLEEFSKCEKI